MPVAAHCEVVMEQGKRNGREWNSPPSNDLFGFWVSQFNSLGLLHQQNQCKRRKVNPLVTPRTKAPFWSEKQTDFLHMPFSGSLYNHSLEKMIIGKRWKIQDPGFKNC